MNFKKLFLGAAIVTFIWYIVFSIGYFDMPEMNKLDRQTYSIMTNIKLLLALAFYVAYRVTP